MKSIDHFRGEHFFLSNFYPCQVELDGVSYNSVEHAYQAAKTLDPKIRFKIGASTAGQAKRLGAVCPMREDWLEIKLSVMESLLRQKFDSLDL